MVDFGERLKTMRLNMGLTQEQLGKRIGVTKSVVSYYELQERYPSPQVLIKLASVFRVTTDYLLGIENKKILDVSDLSDEDIKLLHHTIETLKSKD